MGKYFIGKTEGDYWPIIYVPTDPDTGLVLFAPDQAKEDDCIQWFRAKSRSKMEMRTVLQHMNKQMEKAQGDNKND
tara:strand:- start:108 stop:335 length:228 start_codon:yes stop_codon:yes gene_type:complete